MIARLVAGILTISFAIVAVPFLFLTTSHIVAGDPVATGTLIVYVVYALVLVVVAACWFRKVARANSGRANRSSGRRTQI